VDKDLLGELRAAKEPSPELIASIFASDTPLFMLVGQLLREQEEKTMGLLGVDLTTEEGRLKGLRRQGEAAGALQTIERILEIVTAGKEEKVSNE
jgi:hypothetical protein